MKLDAVHVTWLDASSTSGWLERSDISAEPKLKHSVGWVIKDSEDFLVLACTFDPSTESANAIMHIPQCCIRDVAPVFGVSVD